VIVGGGVAGAERRVPPGAYAEGERCGVTVVAEPLFDPGNERLRDVAPEPAALA
jgi:hypothetical protein